MSEFVALWPIVDEAVAAPELVDEALEELDVLQRRAHARVTGPGHWRVLPSNRVPGSGRRTRLCLVFTAPAEPVAP